MGSPRKLRNTTEVEEFCQGFRVVEVFVGGGEGGVVQGVINVCYRPRVRLCGEERARLGPATSGTAESAASHSFLQSVQPLSGSLNLGFNSTRTSPQNRNTKKHVLPKNFASPKKWYSLGRMDLPLVSTALPLLPTSQLQFATQLQLYKQSWNIFLEIHKGSILLYRFFSRINLLHLSLFFATLSSKFWQTA